MSQKDYGWSTRTADKIEDTGTAALLKLRKWSEDDKTTWTDDALRFGAKGLRGVGTVANLPGVKQTLSVLGAGGWAGGKAGGAIAEALKIDPRLGKWTGGLIGDALAGGAINKVGKVGRTALQIRKLNKKGAGLEALHSLSIGKKPGYTFASGPQGAVKTQANMIDAMKVNRKGQKFLDTVEGQLDGKLPDAVKDVQIARKLKGDTEFVSELAGKTTRMKKLISKTSDKRGHANLSKYKGGDDLITTPTGEKFRYMWKDGRYSWRSMTSEAKRALTRLTGESADLTTVTNQFKNHFNPKQAKEAAQIYVATQQIVKKKIDDVIKNFNKGKAKTDPSKLSLEHITDVKFFDRIKKDVPSFQGRGANELQNLTVLDLPTNMRTGALNKKMDHWQSVIDSVKTGKGFPDYNKSIVNFIYEDVGGMVADFKQKDWDVFLNQMIKRQGDTAYDILIEMARKRN